MFKFYRTFYFEIKIANTILAVGNFLVNIDFSNEKQNY